MKLVDSNPQPQVSHGNELPGKSNYIIGNDRRNWHTQVPRFAQVRYHGVYPGVDLVYYGNQRQLEYDFIVAPGADPDAIELAFEGVENIRVDRAGDLLLDTGDSEVRLKTPVIYQETGGHRVEIPGGYERIGADRVGFHLGSYDSTKPLVIDPLVIYSTYLGGSIDDIALGIAADPGGGAYVTGYAMSVDFPTSPGALQQACAGQFCQDAFITKLSANGTLEYSTYLGGTFEDRATGIALRPFTGDAYITGWTRSPDFPTVNAIDSTFSGDPSSQVRAFVAQLSPDGSALVYSTYLSGDEPSVRANAIAVDSTGAAYVTGSAGAPDGYGPADVFVTKLTPGGSALAYSLRFGGSGDDAGYGIAVDEQGFASVTGATDSRDFPTINAPQLTNGRGFVARLYPDGSQFYYSANLLGGGVGTGIAIAGPNTYVTGWTPDGFLIGNGAVQARFGGGPADAFVQVLNYVGQTTYYTYLGGSGDDRGSAVAVDRNGAVWVTGVTTSPDFPLVHPLQGQVREQDIFIVKFTPGSPLAFSTYLGGSGHELGGPGAPGSGPSLAVDYQYGGAHVAGVTDSLDFPTAGLSPALQPTSHGPLNSFVAFIYDDGRPTPSDLNITNTGGTPAETSVGTVIGYLFEVTNKGPAQATNVTLTDQLPPGAVIAVTNGNVVVGPPSPLRSCAYTSTRVSCTLGTVSAGETVIVAILVMPTASGTLINTATVASDGPEANISDNTVSTTTAVTEGSADLSVTGSASPAVVMPDGTITYTLDVENHGPSAGAAGTLTDVLPAGTTLISATQFGGFGSCTGTSVITCQWPSLLRATVTIVVRATTPGTLSNTATISTAVVDPDTSNNTVTFTTRVNRPPSADAGPDQIVSAGATCQAIVTLNGGGSSDPDGDTLAYAWTIGGLLPPPILFSPIDPSTGAVTGPAPTGPLPLGAHTITLTVTDAYGGTSSDSVVVTVRDVTAPAFSGVAGSMTLEQSSPSGTTSTVGMPTAADNCSGPIALSSNAPATFPPGVTAVTFTARDAAGNTATATTMVTVTDTAPPTLAVASPQAQAYVHSDILTTSFSATDSGSGLAVGMPTARLDGTAVANGQSISMLTLSLGPHSFVLSAGDAAGNSRSQNVAFTVIATIDSLIATVNVFAGQGKIDDSKTVKSLLDKLNDARLAAQGGKKATAISKLQDFINQVNAQRGRHITADAAQILVTDAQYVIGTLR
jgi:uncharacterized repeat protein (TIGR01451 family)